MAATTVSVPDLGDFTDVPVIELLVAIGDAVAAEDPLLTLESDKATMDVPSPVAGAVAKLLVGVGDTVSQGDAIAIIDSGSETDAAPATDAMSPAETAEGDPPQPPPPTPQPGNGDAPIYASPSVRRLARERGVDLRRVVGTGRKGRITPADVEAAMSVPAREPSAPTGPDMAPWPEVDYAQFGEIERVPLSRIQRIAGPALARNWAHIPHVTQFDEADITELEAFRKEINADQEIKVTLLSLLMVACAVALQEFPHFNASLDGEQLVLKRYYHLGFAADTEQGLVVPVVRDVESKGLLHIAGEVRDLAHRAREGTLSFDQMRGGTFTISSLGGIGGTAFTPIVNAPEVAILGVSRAFMKPVWDGERFAPRLTLPLSLSYDHRAIDGADGARFTGYLGEVLADIRKALL